MAAAAELLTLSPWANVTGSELNMTDGGSGGGNPNLPALKLANQVVLGVTLGLVMVAMGAAIEPKDFKIVLRRPVGVAIGFVCQVILMPLIGFTMAVILRLEAAQALGALITASSPGGTTSNLYTFWTDGDICLSVIMTTISTLIALGSMPLNLFIYSRHWTDDKTVIPYTDIVITLATVIGPVGLGMVLRWWKKKWAIVIGTPFGAIGMLGIFTSIVITSFINPAIWTTSWRLYFANFAHMWIGWSLGYLIARLLRQPHRQARTIAFETGAQQVGLALALISFSFNDDLEVFLDAILYPMIFGPFSIISFCSWVAGYKLYRYYRPEVPEVPEEEEEEEEKEEGEKKKMREEDEQGGENEEEANKNGIETLKMT